MGPGREVGAAGSAERPRGRPFGSRAAFRQALHEAFALAARRGSPRLWLVDPDFAHWPLDEREVLESLQQWARPHRRLTLLAHHFDAVARMQPRFVAWRRRWSHIVECRARDPAEGTLPSWWVASGLGAVRLLDAGRFRGVVDEDATLAQGLAQQCDAFSQRASPAFSAYTLGL